MEKLFFAEANLVNEGRVETGNLLVADGRIERLGGSFPAPAGARVIDCAGKWLLPGVIDDQVHFREPGLTHKATLQSESRAAVAGGVTGYLEMPNTKPPTDSAERLEEKCALAAAGSAANYGFMLGASQEGPTGNLEAVKALDPRRIPSLKIFMGSSTGNLLVDRSDLLEAMFRASPVPICVHAEDDRIIAANLERARQRWGEAIPPEAHAEIRSAEACLASTRKAIALAERTGARLHVYHLSTADEAALFSPGPVAGKKITAEVCVHHLWFERGDYARLGNRIKCNPSIKEASHRAGLWKALGEGRLDVIATDHAPHTVGEKSRPYLEAPSGLPLVQHSLAMMLRFVQEKKLTIESVVEHLCHAPATLFRIRERGFLREGWWADLVVVDPTSSWTVARENILYQCGWSPLEGERFSGAVTHTVVSGQLAFENRRVNPAVRGMRMEYGPQGA
ncbi:MAG: dihydroorotase [Spirochaetes bacterium]|nr:dihydroorotase [Spirochaetota bacterium]